MKRVLLAAAATVLFASCYHMEGELMVYNAREYVVASRQPCYWYDGSYHPYFLIRSAGSGNWESCDDIQGLVYSEGTEYHIVAEKVVDTERYKIADDYSGEYLRLVRVLSAEKKDSSDLPDGITYYSDNPAPPE